MIKMSRFLGLFVVLLVAGITGCGVSTHACTLVGCFDGLVVSFEGLQAGTGYDIVIDNVTPLGPVPIATCTVLSAAPGAQVACSSAEGTSEFGSSVQIRDYSFKAVRITVSSGGTQVVQHTFDVRYDSREINGPGCGVCTSARVTMTIPPVANASE